MGLWRRDSPDHERPSLQGRGGGESRSGTKIRRALPMPVRPRPPAPFTVNAVFSSLAQPACLGRLEGDDRPDDSTRRLYGRLQLPAQAQDRQRPHALRIHRQNLDFKATAIHPLSDPPDAETEHVVSRSRDASALLIMKTSFQAILRMRDLRFHEGASRLPIDRRRFRRGMIRPPKSDHRPERMVQSGR